ncbi:uncharacterized protein [Periplaneta americana]|uniref:uncharacterized protein n=1 Tax=Periplaneta americana TaxID=6978 RepID=UPI0037E8F6DD
MELGKAESQTAISTEKCWKKSSYKRQCLFWILVFYGAALFYYISMRNDFPYLRSVRRSYSPVQKIITARHAFLINTSGCRIPHLEAFNYQVQPYLSKVNPIICSDKPLLVNSNRTALFIETSALPAYGINDIRELKCCYKPFFRVPNDDSKQFDNSVKFNETCTTFENAAEVNEEFVKVICAKNSRHISEHYHAFTPLKPKVEKRCSEIRHNISEEIQDSLSILIVGMDSVSRINLHRQMPKTVKLLQEISAIELLGYNKVADNTFPNLIPILSGLTEREMKSSCWPEEYLPLDDCPWIWKNFSSAGYRTGYGEDAIPISLFVFTNNGFKQQPTDYYLKPFMKVAEERIAHEKQYTASLCLGPQLAIDVLLNYIYKFASTFSRKHSFGFFWAASLTHDNINYPRHADEIYMKFITNLIESGSISKSVLILLSDHGIRWGKFREIYQGRLEERLPYALFVLPEWFRNKYTEAVTNLHKNAARLTSPFDIYETILDFIDLKQLENLSIQKRSLELRQKYPKPRGISLFLPVEETRTCKEAGITPEWCTCYNSTDLPLNDATVKNMSMILIDHLNSLLKVHKNCSQLSLAEVRIARVQVPVENVFTTTQDEGLLDYVLVVETKPGNGLFEAMIRHHVKTNEAKVQGFVSRINTYRNQSACIKDHFMKLYCFCKH